MNAERQFNYLMEESLSPSIAALMAYVWSEASGELERVLSVPVSSVKVESVSQAESCLLKIRDAIRGKGNANVNAEAKLFYEKLPHNESDVKPLDSLRVLSSKQDLCQVKIFVFALCIQQLSVSIDWVLCSQ